MSAPLGLAVGGASVRLLIDGMPVVVPAGATVAAACAIADRARAQAEPVAVRRSVTGEARQAFCGMGVCGECRVEIDGRAHRLGCATACEDGMSVRRADAVADGAGAAGPGASGRVRSEPFAGGATAPEATTDVAIVGAGPAGLAAAEAAAREGARVLVVDAAPRPGGQIWRAVGTRLAAPVAAQLARLEALGVPVMAGTRVAWPLGDGPAVRLLLDHGARASTVGAARLVIATGGRERLPPFPGWTRPGVFGAGGLQALAKGGWPVAGRRVLVAGTGPLLLATAATLRRAGAIVVEVAEEVDRAAVARFGASLALRPGPLRVALGLAAGLVGVPYRAGWRVVAAQGATGPDADRGPLVRVVLAHLDGRVRTVACDALAAGWGLVPQVELALALGCATASVRGAMAVCVDADQRTSVAHVFAAGEPTGIAGVDAARASGAIAGRAAAREVVRARAAGASRSATATAPATAAATATASAQAVISNADPADPTDARARRALARAQRFATLVAATFPPPTDTAAATRCRDDTLVCRCEDVPASALRGLDDPRTAKLATRCGMGHCQGRVCQGASGARPPRPALAPIPLSHWLVPDDAAPASAAWPPPTDHEPASHEELP